MQADPIKEISSSTPSEIQQSDLIQNPQEMGEDSSLHTEIAEKAKAPERLKEAAQFLKKVITTPPSLLLKGVEYTALAAFAFASTPAVFGQVIGEHYAKKTGQVIHSTGEKGFQIGAILVAPILAPLAAIGLGAGIGSSALKALGSGQKNMDIWLSLHIARRAHHLHYNLEGAYLIDFKNIAQKIEQKVLKDYAEKCVDLSHEAFKKEAEALSIPGDYQRALCFAKAQQFAKHSQPKITDPELLKEILPSVLEISSQEVDLLEEMVDFVSKN